MNILIVDDEPLAVKRLHQFIDNTPGYNCAGCAFDGVEAVQKAHQLNVDIVLMDIRMPKMDGLTAARHIRDMENPPAIIFTTAFAEYSLHAFSIPASGYLLKPIIQPKLIAAIENIKSMTPRAISESLQIPHEKEEYICCRHYGEFLLIAFRRIYYLKSSTKYTQIYYHNSSSLTERSLKSFLEYYPDRLIRINRGIAVNRAYLRGLRRINNDQYEAILSKVGKGLLVSRRNLPHIRAHLNQIGHSFPLVTELPDETDR